MRYLYWIFPFIASFYLACSGQSSKDNQFYLSPEEKLRELASKTHRNAEEENEYQALLQEAQAQNVRDEFCKKARFTSVPDSLEVFEEILKKGADPNTLCLFNYSRERLGAKIPIVRDFMQNKYKTTSVTESVLHKAVRSKNTALIDLMLKYDADMNLENENGLTPLSCALLSADKVWLQELIDKGADPKKASLSMCLDEKVAIWMVDKGANPKTLDLNHFLFQPDMDLLPKIIQLKPDLSKVESRRITIFENEAYQIMKLLLENGLDPNQPSSESFLIDAVRRRSTNIMQLLIDHGANVNAKSTIGRIAIVEALERRDEEKTRILLQAGADIHVADHFDDYPLAYAIQTNDPKLVRLLVQKGAKKANKKESGLAYAKRNGASTEVIKVLK